MTATSLPGSAQPVYLPPLQPCYPERYDLVVVECQIVRQFRDIEPPSLGRVIPGPQPSWVLLEDAREDYSYLPSPWIPATRAKCAHLLQGHVFQSGFLLQLTADGIFEFLILLNKASGQCPLTLERLISSLNQEHPGFSLVESEHYGVDRNHRPRPFIHIPAFPGHTDIPFANVNFQHIPRAGLGVVQCEAV